MQVQCPHCSKMLNAPDEKAGQAVSCPSCGGQMQLPAAAGAPAGNEIGIQPPAGQSGIGAGDGASKKCPYCGEEIQASAVKCRHCGEFLEAATRKRSAEGDKALTEYRKGMKILAVVLFIVGGLALLGGVCMVVGLGMAGGNIRVPQELLVGMLIVVLGLGALYVVFGFFALKLHGWVNWAVGVLATLVLISNVVSLGGPKPGRTLWASS